VLLLSDCAPVVSQIESAYRAGRAEGLRATDRGAMLEAICEYRARLGMVVVFWVPSHEGQVSNAYADAVAKMHLDAPLEAGLTAGVAECVASRPCLYERQVAGEWELWDRPAFRGTRLQAEGWVAAALADGLTPGRLMAGRADFWGALAARVGRPLGVEHGDTSKAIAATALTFGLRVGEVAGVRHGDVWAKRRLAEGDGGGPCTREGRWGCAACLAARWQQAGQGPGRRRRRRRGAGAGGAQGGVAGATPAAGAALVANAFHVLPVEDADEPEERARFETLRHVLTECQATAGRGAAAGKLAAQCRAARAQLAGEAGEQPARAFLATAQAGWEAAAVHQVVTPAQWSAMRETLAGAAPEWVPEQAKEGEGARRAKEVAGCVRHMHATVGDMLAAHRKRGAAGAEWVRQREARRPLLHALLRAWAAVVATRKAGGVLPDEQVAGSEAWEQWVAEQPEAATRVRRVGEAAQRVSAVLASTHALTRQPGRAKRRWARALAHATAVAKARRRLAALRERAKAILWAARLRRLGARRKHSDLMPLTYVTAPHFDDPHLTAPHFT